MPNFFKKVRDALGGSSPWNDRRSSAYDMPSDPNQVQWDPETGLPIGINEPPPHEYAQKYAWKSREVVAQRNASLRRQAMGFLDQAARISETFRPGGYAGTVGSGIFRDKADLAMRSQIDEPDVSQGWRDEQAHQARVAARRGGRMSFAGGIVQAGLSLIPGIGPAVGAAAGSAMQGMASGYAGEAANYGRAAQGPGPAPGGGAPMMGQQGPGQPGPAGGAPGAAPSVPRGTPPGAPQGGGYGEPEGGGAPPPSGGKGGQMGAPMLDPYFLAETIFFDSTQDGFDQTVDFLTRQALADRLAEYGAVA